MKTSCANALRIGLTDAEVINCCSDEQADMLLIDELKIMCARKDRRRRVIREYGQAANLSLGGCGGLYHGVEGSN